MTVLFLGRRVAGIVIRVESDERRLLVRTEEDETIEFSLSRATGTFLAAGSQSGPRLVFDH